MSILDQGNINLTEKSGKNHGTFEELENQFWKNIDKLKKLKNNTKAFKELFSESEEILSKVHELNQG